MPSEIDANQSQSRFKLLETFLERLEATISRTSQATRVTVTTETGIQRSPQMDEMFRDALRESPVRRIRDGFLGCDPDAAGKSFVTVEFDSGPIERYVRADYVGDDQVADSDATVPESVSVESCVTRRPWDVLGNPQSDFDAKKRALDQWCDQSSEDVGRFAADELGRNDLSEAWRDHLVFVVEDIAITDAGVRQRLRERLIEIARSLRKSPKAGVERIVWSAIRRAVSLSAPNEIEWLLDFMTLQGPVDTRLAAIQCVSRKFEAAQPQKSHELELLESRVAEFAHKYLDPDVFAGGGNAAIAQNAIVALVVLGSDKWDDVSDSVRQLQKRWFVRQLSQKLERLLAARTSAGWPNIELERLREQIASLDAMAAN